MAIESLKERVFSSQSDVWSYGVVLWEIFSLSGVPYPGIKEEKLLHRYLLQKHRMPRPFYASNQIYEIMISCWNQHPKDRPTFRELQDQILSQLRFCAHL